ncbi:MAG TPA: GGDEF domain-containing protein [Bacilli bacterium]|nr:MAG: putative diguanylate cyclase YcdT [Tenericutes bacterium ADurb.BinA124]HOH17889.1 GGDEF domain-containing protein [Bacilli bacterium]HPX85005.1 GGDEF domain-containing protein [Bacilli bacterium]
MMALQNILIASSNNGIVLEEILVANAIGLLVLIVSLLSRVEIKKERHLSGKIFDGMVWITFFALILETVTFLLDEKPGALVHFLQYATNTYLFLASSLVGILWVLFVDIRIFRSSTRIKWWLKFLIIPYIALIVLIIFDYFGADIIFSITEQNKYDRGKFVMLTFGFVFCCYFITLALAVLAVKRDGHIRFFPVHYFVIPSLLGTLVQGMFYGLAAGWLCLSIALLFVQLHLANQNAYEDELSGLYNRKYFGWMIEKLAKGKKNRFISAIMMDIDRFKLINDEFGHSVGDDAIRSIGKLLTDITSDDVIAFRVGGDEFTVLHIGGTEADIEQLTFIINERISDFNKTAKKPYSLSVSMGYSTCQTTGTSLDFFFHQLDQKMYEQKALQYAKNQK